VEEEKPTSSISTPKPLMQKMTVHTDGLHITGKNLNVVDKVTIKNEEEEHDLLVRLKQPDKLQLELKQGVTILAEKAYNLIISSAHGAELFPFTIELSEEMQASLKGEAGEKGDKGDPGEKGEPGDVAILEGACDAGQFLTGFNASGEPLCGSVSISYDELQDKPQLPVIPEFRYPLIKDNASNSYVLLNGNDVYNVLSESINIPAGYSGKVLVTVSGEVRNFNEQCERVLIGISRSENGGYMEYTSMRYVTPPKNDNPSISTFANFHSSYMTYVAPGNTYTFYLKAQNNVGSDCQIARRHMVIQVFPDAQ
jgi:hypothetical protein